jgi:hypothetical protein
MSKTKTSTLALSELPAHLATHAAQFAALHQMAKIKAGEFKLAAFLAGYAAQAIADAHGETRGGDHSSKAESKTDTVSVLPLGELYEAVFGVTERTVRRYRNLYTSTITAKPKLAKALVTKWQLISGQKSIGDGEAADKALATLAAHGSPESIKQLLELCAQEDDWSMAELFEKPAPALEVEGDGKETAAERRARMDALLKFWNFGVLRRMRSEEFLKLPKPQLEALAHEFREAAEKAENAAKGKAKTKPAKAKK